MGIDTVACCRNFECVCVREREKVEQDKWELLHVKWMHVKGVTLIYIDVVASNLNTSCIIIICVYFGLMLVSGNFSFVVIVFAVFSGISLVLSVFSKWIFADGCCSYYRIKMFSTALVLPFAIVICVLGYAFYFHIKFHRICVYFNSFRKKRISFYY